VGGIIVIGLPTLYLAVRYRKYRKFIAGAFFVSSGMQFYFYLVKIEIPLLWTTAVQSTQLGAVRGTIHFVLYFWSVGISDGASANNSPHRNDARPVSQKLPTFPYSKAGQEIEGTHKLRC
jgi:hypothetical protein